MTVTGRNYSHIQTPAEVDTEYVRCNFNQAVAGTRLFPGDDTPRTFIDCSLMNCVLPPGSTSPGSPPTSRTRDIPNDETVTIDGVDVVVEAWKVERV